MHFMQKRFATISVAYIEICMLGLFPVACEEEVICKCAQSGPMWPLIRITAQDHKVFVLIFLAVFIFSSFLLLPFLNFLRCLKNFLFVSSSKSIFRYFQWLLVLCSTYWTDRHMFLSSMTFSYHSYWCTSCHCLHRLLHIWDSLHDVFSLLSSFGGHRRRFCTYCMMPCVCINFYSQTRVGFSYALLLTLQMIVTIFVIFFTQTSTLSPRILFDVSCK